MDIFMDNKLHHHISVAGPTAKDGEEGMSAAPMRFLLEDVAQEQPWTAQIVLIMAFFVVDLNMFNI